MKSLTRPAILRPKHTLRSSREAGFSLLELMVVVVILSILALVIIVSMLGLRWIEDRHAMIQGTVSPFAQLDLYDSFVWLFTYVGNGFTADNIYPVSFAGKVVTGVLAVLGLVLAGPAG